MKRFDHENIVKLLGVCTRGEPIYAVMEFMLHGMYNRGYTLRVIIEWIYCIVTFLHTVESVVAPHGGGVVNSFIPTNLVQRGKWIFFSYSYEPHIWKHYYEISFKFCPLSLIYSYVVWFCLHKQVLTIIKLRYLAEQYQSFMSHNYFKFSVWK